MALFPCVSRVLQHLEQRHWLDHYTKALFVEFTVFNANVNLLCVVTLILESSGVGMQAFSPSSATGYLRTRQPFLIIYHSFKYI